MHAARALALTLRKRSNTYKKYSSSRKTKPTFFFCTCPFVFRTFYFCVVPKESRPISKVDPGREEMKRKLFLLSNRPLFYTIFLCVRPWCYNNTQRREWLRLRQQRFTPVGQLNRPWWYNSYTFCRRPLDFRHDGSSMTSWEELIVLPKPNSSPSIW